MHQLLSYVLLGLVQGVTEFLPISSDGHLVLLGRWVHTPGDELAVIVLLHTGSLAALLWAFRRELLGIVRPPREPGAMGGPGLLGLLVLSTLPVAVFGPMFYAAFNSAFASPDFAAWMLVVTGLILIATRTFRVGTASVNPLSALAMGVAQIFALLPGISRSALTMATGFALGVDRVRVARFSFLMAIPAIIGATIYELMRLGGMADVDPLGITAGILAAFASGLIAIRALLFLVRRGRFEWFGVYCMAVGALFLVIG